MCVIALKEPQNIHSWLNKQTNKLKPHKRLRSWINIIKVKPHKKLRCWINIIKDVNFKSTATIKFYTKPK